MLAAALSFIIPGLGPITLGLFGWVIHIVSALEAALWSPR